MSLFGKRLITMINNRARNIGFRDIKHLAYWVHLGVDARTILSWGTLDIKPSPDLIKAIDALLSQIEEDPKHYIRNFARKEA